MHGAFEPVRVLPRGANLRVFVGLNSQALISMAGEFCSRLLWPERSCNELPTLAASGRYRAAGGAGAVQVGASTLLLIFLGPERQADGVGARPLELYCHPHFGIANGWNSDYCRPLYLTLMCWLHVRHDPRHLLQQRA